MNTLKNIGAVIAGFITVALLSTVTDAFLEKTGFFPSQSDAAAYAWWMLLIALIYRMIYTVAGGYVTARTAHDRPMRQVTILGLLGIIGGTIGIFAGWHLGHHWYPIAITVTAFPLTWYGGTLKKTIHREENNATIND